MPCFFAKKYQFCEKVIVTPICIKKRVQRQQTLEITGFQGFLLFQNGSLSIVGVKSVK
jgi:hypothetical protein